MLYSFVMRNMRRSDREKPRDFALEVTDKCAYSVMATVNADGSPYCIPLSLAREGEWLYFHCALEGHKIDNLRSESRVCISCVGDVKVIPREFGIEYESAVINGTAQEITDREEKTRALSIISRRYTPEDMDIFEKELERNFDKTAVWKIHIDGISGKGRKRK